MLSRKEIVEQLIQYGHTKEKLDGLQAVALERLFKKESKKRIATFLEEAQKSEQITISIDDEVSYVEREIQTIHEAISGEEIDFITLYDAIERIFEKYDLNEIIELALSRCPDRRYKQTTQIVEIAFRAYQETLLGEIEKLCEDYPVQERFEQMKFYSDKRADVAFLRKSIQSMQIQNQQKSLSRITQQKYDIIREYYPDLMYESYEEFYENEEEKEAIIGRIMALTSAYKRAQLRKKKSQILKHIERVLLEDREREKEEKALIKQYMKKIGDAIALEDELEFGEVLKDALKVLDERDVQYIVEHFDISMNPLILQRFNVIMRENRPR